MDGEQKTKLRVRGKPVRNQLLSRGELNYKTSPVGDQSLVMAGSDRDSTELRD